jgi:hypothetical protein
VASAKGNEEEGGAGLVAWLSVFSFSFLKSLPFSLENFLHYQNAKFIDGNNNKYKYFKAQEIVYEKIQFTKHQKSSIPSIV